MKLTKIVLNLLIVVLMYGCSTEASVKVSNQLTSPYITDTDHQRQDDTALEQKIERLFTKHLIGDEIQPVVLNYDVLLVGQVSSNADRSKAVRMVKNLPSPKHVFNYIKVAAKPKLNTNSKINEQAVDRLETQNNINGKAMKVITVDNVVYLMGTNLGDLTALNTAINGIYSIPGVRKVINLVQPGDQDYYSKTAPKPEG